MDWHRTLSALVVATYVVLACASGGALGVLLLLTKLLLPLALIWFPEELGQYAGTVRLQIMSQPTPAGFVRFAGWALLLMPVWLPIFVWAMRPLCGFPPR